MLTNCSLFVKVKVCDRVEPGHGHNGSTFVFCGCDCLFDTKPIPTSAHACGHSPATMLAITRSVGVAPEVDVKECTLYS